MLNADDLVLMADSMEMLIAKMKRQRADGKEKGLKLSKTNLME